MYKSEWAVLNMYCMCCLVLKLVHVVNIELGYQELFFYSFVILNESKFHIKS